MSSLPEGLFAHLAVTTCCLCLEREACLWSGHVTRGAEKIFAGWCRECQGRLDSACSVRLRSLPKATWSIEAFVRCDLAGWCGHWLPVMGELPWGELERRWAAIRAATAEQSGAGA